MTLTYDGIKFSEGDILQHLKAPPFPIQMSPLINHYFSMQGIHKKNSIFNLILKLIPAHTNHINSKL